jgi:AraC-like DNA-binding protein
MDVAAEAGSVSSPSGLPIASLLLGDGVRGGGLDEAHVVLLMETVEQWPPIVVWGEERLVIDGAHRVEAARRLGHSRVMAVRFVGSRDEAFVESVRRNVDHGLPLSVADRRRAVVRVLRRHPDWSDRRIAAVCGLSGRSVARLRRDEVGSSVGEATVVGLERRVGRDGKTRPVQAGEVRERIREALEENPAGSLRTIAAVAGASPETVRTVRARLALGGGPDALLHSVPSSSFVALSGSVEGLPRDSCGGGAVAACDDRVGDRRVPWVTDSALLACGDGGDFARWFAANKVEEDWHQYVWTIPLGRLYEVVDEARRRAATWTAFASVLESRTR